MRKVLWVLEFNEGTGDILTDLSGNGNNGTIYGVESTDVPGEIEAPEQPVISVTPEFYDFEQVIHGDTLETDFIITNNGDGILEWSAQIFETEDRSNSQNPEIGFFSNRNSEGYSASINLMDFKNSKSKRSASSTQNNRDQVGSDYLDMDRMLQEQRL